MDNSHSIILFDGICNLCNSSINFVIDRDPRKIFKFAALQSEAGKKLLSEYHLHTLPFESIILIENGKAYHESTAVLRIARRLPGAWKLFYVLMIFPAFLRNPVYKFIAKRRYKWFGKRDVCRIPEQGVLDRFL